MKPGMNDVYFMIDYSEEVQVTCCGDNLFKAIQIAEDKKNILLEDKRFHNIKIDVPAIIGEYKWYCDEKDILLHVIRVSFMNHSYHDNGYANISSMYISVGNTKIKFFFISNNIYATDTINRYQYIGTIENIVSLSDLVKKAIHFMDNHIDYPIVSQVISLIEE